MGSCSVLCMITRKGKCLLKLWIKRMLLNQISQSLWQTVLHCLQGGASFPAADDVTREGSQPLAPSVSVWAAENCLARGRAMPECHSSRDLLWPEWPALITLRSPGRWLRLCPAGIPPDCSLCTILPPVSLSKRWIPHRPHSPQIPSQRHLLENSTFNIHSWGTRQLIRRHTFKNPNLNRTVVPSEDTQFRHMLWFLVLEWRLEMS